MRRRLLLALAAAALPAPAHAATETVDAGALQARVTSDPWRVELLDAKGAPVLAESQARGGGAAASLGARTALGWSHATRAPSLKRDGAAVTADVETTGGARLSVRIEPAGGGVIRLSADAPGATATGMGFDSAPGERYFGFGERSNVVDARGTQIENYVADGPFRPEDRQFPKATTPPWASSDRDDATYFPVPWLLSSRGYGVLIDRDETSRFELGGAPGGPWGLEADSARLDLRFFAGPTPAQALERFTGVTGRQPPPPAPYAFGPWFQTGQKNKIPLEEEAAAVKKLRAADAPVSVAETQMHFLPCGAQRGNEDYNRRRTEFFHSQGLAHLVYLNPLLCASYQPVYDEARQAGVLQRLAAGGLPYLYTGFVGGSEPAGFTVEPLSQFDFTAPGAKEFYGRLVREVFDGGHDGWMEDFGEYTPPDAVSADGTPGPAMHNRYPTDYHCAAFDIARALPRPVIRFQRSGWTGSARCAYDVWGGDPTTVFGYDGLQSAVRQALSMGLSGVSRWGTDIGGYNSFGPAETLDAELLKRWIEFGSVAGVMRTKGSGLAIPSYRRPQIYDDDVLPVWKRYAKLHTRLYPYIATADAAYRRTGMPLMRHLALTTVGDDAAAAREDEFMFGPDLLAAPVLEARARQRSLYAPAGTWVDLWRSVRYDEGSGDLDLSAASVLPGGRSHTLPAPLDELPLLVRAGAVLPLLPADVDTLSDEGSEPGLVHLKDRAGRLTLLAFPRGHSLSEIGEGERVRSIARPRSWSLSIRGRERRLYEIQASLATLDRPFTPRRLTLNGRRLKRGRWHYDKRTRVLRLTVSRRAVRIRVTR